MPYTYPVRSDRYLSDSLFHCSILSIHANMRKLKIHKTITKRNLNNQEGKDSEGIRIPELRPQILKFHKFLK